MMKLQSSEVEEGNLRKRIKIQILKYPQGLYNKVNINQFINLEHEELQAKLENSEDQRLIEEFENRIKKTESDEKKDIGPPKQLQEIYKEEEEEESDDEINPDHQVFYPQDDEYEDLFRKTDKEKFPKPGQGPENENFDYEDYLNTLSEVQAKAKKYKKKAKKLYSNLEKLKIHYEKAKRNISELEFENQGLNNQLMIHSERLNRMEHSYQNQ